PALVTPAHSASVAFAGITTAVVAGTGVLVQTLARSLEDRRRLCAGAVGLAVAAGALVLGLVATVALRAARGRRRGAVRHGLRHVPRRRPARDRAPGPRPRARGQHRDLPRLELPRLRRAVRVRPPGGSGRRARLPDRPRGACGRYRAGDAGAAPARSSRPDDRGGRRLGGP